MSNLDPVHAQMKLRLPVPIPNMSRAGTGPRSGGWGSPPLQCLSLQLAHLLKFLESYQR